MAQSLVRAPGPTDTNRRTRTGGALAPPFLAFLITFPVAGCVSYEPAPVDASQVLHDLETLQ